jgi:hypothetical protein
MSEAGHTLFENELFLAPMEDEIMSMAAISAAIEALSVDSIVDGKESNLQPVP